MASINYNTSCLKCKCKHNIFKTLNDEELTLIDNNRLEVSYYEGEIIFKQGSPITHIASITKGLAKLYIEGYNKKNLILQYSGPGDFFGGPGAFTDNLHHFSVAAVEETSACLISVDIFKSIMHKNIDFAFGYIENISDKGILNFERFISLTQKQMHGRVAEALIYYKDKVYNNRTNGFPLHRKDLSEITALSKDSAGRILNSLIESKIIELTDNNIKIINRKLLEEISNKG